MTNRNIWTYAETTIMLQTMKDCLHLDAKLRRSEIYEMIEKEMFSKGYTSKRAKQIEFRWKNLKKNYIQVRKSTKNGRPATTNFYKQLDAILGSCPKLNDQLDKSQQESGSEPACEKACWQPDPLGTFIDPVNVPIYNPSSTPRKRRKDISLHEDVTVHYRNDAQTEDEFDIVGKHFAIKLRKLPNLVRLTTEKLITDIIYQAQLGVINTQTTITINNIENQSKGELEEADDMLKNM